MTEEKPWTYNTMVLDNKIGDELKIIILPLSDFVIDESVKDEVTVTIEMKAISDLQDGMFVLTVSDDPYMRHAGDWVHLGCSRIRIVMKLAKVIKSKDGYITLRSKKEHFEFEILLPERRFPK